MATVEMRNRIEVTSIYDAMNFISLHIKNGYTVSVARVSYGPISGEKYLIVADKEKEEDDGTSVFENGDAAKWKKFELSNGL